MLIVSFVSIGKRVLWPNSGTDPAYQYPTPPGGFGCPLFGHNIMAGNKVDGPETFYWKKSKQMKNHPKIWKFYFMGSPIVSLVGSKLVTKIQNLEFTKLTSSLNKVSSSSDSKGKKRKDYSVYITDNINFETNKSKHRFLRSMLGSAMAPVALQSITPAIRNIAEKMINRIIIDSSSEGSNNKKQEVRMEEICTEYTTEIVQTQILGIDNISDPIEKEHFRLQLQIWLKNIVSLWVNSGILVRFSKAYKARKYLEEKIMDQINLLKQGGNKANTTSTLSNMVFAVNEEEEEDGQTRLTEKQVLENALFLVAAGTETSSSTLTLLVAALSLNPEVWRKLKEEVRANSNNDDLQVIKGNDDGRSLYEKFQPSTMPYLDAVVKEALRIGPITGGFPRKVQETIIVDDEYQIPKGWSVFGNYRLSHYLDPKTRNSKDPNDTSHMNIRTGFQPERWLSTETTPSEFLAFGAGPRYCLGSNLALLEMKMFLFVLAKKIDSLELAVPAEKLEWNPVSMIPKPLDGATLRITPRRHNDNENGSDHQLVNDYNKIRVNETAPL